MIETIWHETLKIALCPITWILSFFWVFSRLAAWRIIRDLSLILKDYGIQLDKEQRKKWSRFLNLIFSMGITFFLLAYVLYFLTHMVFLR